MPVARQSKILGPNGKPYTIVRKGGGPAGPGGADPALRELGHFLYGSPRFNPRSYKPRYWLGADTKSNVSEFDRWEMLNYSRQLFAQIPALYGAIMQKNAWAFGEGWDAHYFGTNQAWGDQVEEWLRWRFYPNANIRGSAWDLKWSLKVSGYMLDVDGDDAMVFAEDEDGSPRLAFYPATRIGSAAAGTNSSMIGKKSRTTEDSIISGGAFDGAQTFDGIILDRNQKMIGLRITGDDFKLKDLPAASCDLAFEPVWPDQVRGIPRVAAALLRWMNTQDIDDFILRGMKRASSIGVTVHKEEGEAGLGNEVVTGEVDQFSSTQTTQQTPGGPQVPSNQAGRQIYYEEIEGGEMWYLTANSGEKIEGVDYTNPHPNSEAFIARIVREALSSLGWAYELMDFAETGRAPARLVVKLANMAVSERQSSGMRRWRKAIGYAIAKGVENGEIPRNDTNSGMDQFMFEPGMPAELSVDQGNDEQADRENFKLGTTSKTIIAQKHGLHRHTIRRHRMKETLELLEDVKAIMAKDQRVTFEMAMGLLEQRTPNASPIPVPAPAGAAAGGEE